ncbi:hypothetical protein BV20DRAFT_674689 [Pilatotrama ljubarskyi]|nr:hypothetical protein BV20DRAFT_674689 [Pilatotrama ljubarskyi]
MPVRLHSQGLAWTCGSLSVSRPTRRITRSEGSAILPNERAHARASGIRPLLRPTLWIHPRPQPDTGDKSCPPPRALDRRPASCMMNIAHVLLVYLLWIVSAHAVSSDVSAALTAACQVIVDPCTSDTALTNRTSRNYIRDGHSPRQGLGCYAPQPSHDVPTNQSALPDLADDDTPIPWPPHRDAQVCQTLSAMLVVPRSHQPRPSSAVISVPLDANSSFLVTVLRSCSLWELVSLFSAFAWLFVCLAS